jgi:hypothetical protein
MTTMTPLENTDFRLRIAQERLAGYRATGNRPDYDRQLSIIDRILVERFHHMQEAS